MSGALTLVVALLGAEGAQSSEWRSVASEAVWAAPESLAGSGAKRAASSSMLVRNFSVIARVSRSTGITGLLDLIASAEVREGYNSVQMGATVKPPRPPVQMTIEDIRSWVRQTPDQHHAIGRYQVIPTTFDRLVVKLGLAPSERFTPAVQDRMAKTLATEAGYLDFARGTLSRADFQDNLARVWAGLPLASGKSAYHGLAGNRATITQAQFDRRGQPCPNCRVSEGCTGARL